VLHLHQVFADPAAEVAMEHQRRDRHDQARGGADQGLADAAGQQADVAHAVVEDAHEHLDHADHGPEQAQQGADRRDRAEGVEEAFHPVDQVPADVLDPLAHLVARALAHVQRGRQERAQRRGRAQGLDVLRIELAARGPGPHLLAEPRGQHRLAPQRPEPLDDDRQRERRQQQQRDHRPAARHHQFQHALSSGPQARSVRRTG
jgi:hypothetical protein